MTTKYPMISLDSPKYSAGGKHYALGAESIIGHVTEHHPNIEFAHFDLQSGGTQKMDTTLKWIHDNKPEVIWISTKIGGQHSMSDLMHGIAEIKAADPEYKPTYVLGGAYATFANKIIGEAIAEAGYAERNEILQIRRQGEVSAEMLIAQKFADYDRIPNLVRWTGDQWKINHHHITDAPNVNDFTKIALPATQTVQEIREQNGVIWAERSRGCAAHCTFCSIKSLRGEHNTDIRPAEQVVKHLTQLADMGVTYVSFADDDFPILTKRKIPNTDRFEVVPDDVDEFITLMKESGLDKRIQWSISTRASNMFDASDTPEIAEIRAKRMKEMKEIGLESVFVGFESFNREQQKRYGIIQDPHGAHATTMKTAETNMGVIHALEKVDIKLVGGFIPLDPLMNDLGELEENMRVLRETGLWKYVTNPLSDLRVQVDTPYHTKASRAGILDEGPRTNFRLPKPNTSIGDEKDGERDPLVFFDARYLNPVVGALAQAAREWSDRIMQTNFGLKAIRQTDLPPELKASSQQWLEAFRLQEVELVESLAAEGKKIDPNQDGKEIQHAKKAYTDIIKSYEKKRIEMVETLKKSPLGEIPELKEAIRNDLRNMQIFASTGQSAGSGTPLLC